MVPKSGDDRTIRRDIAIALSTHRPKDHILFLRNLLNDISDMRDKPRIVLLAPPHMSIRKIAEYIKEETGVQIIASQDFIDGDVDKISSSDLAYAISKHIDKYEMLKTGWIMYEFPRDFTEAKFFQKCGLFPTHTFQICSSPDLYSSKDAWFENIKDWPIDKFREAMADFKRRALRIRRALSHYFREIPVNGRTNQELARACMEYTKVPVSKGAPMIPRVVLIGTRGSRRRTMAQYLVDKYKLVHVDIEYMIIQGKQKDDDFGEKLKTLEIQHAPIYAKLMISMLQQRLLQRDCLHRGWVLTNFPRDVADFRVLDNLDTPPNKVIFLSVEPAKAYQRLKNRKVNIYDGEVKNLDEIIKDGEDVKEYFTHPREYDVNVCAEQEEYAKNVEEMLRYCGDNCYVVDADGTDDVVCERIKRVMLQPSPIARPRNLDVSPEPSADDNMGFVIKGPSHTSIYPKILETDCSPGHEPPSETFEGLRKTLAEE